MAVKYHRFNKYTWFSAIHRFFNDPLINGKHIGNTFRREFILICLGDAIWPHMTWSTHAQVTACCPMAPTYTSVDLFSYPLIWPLPDDKCTGNIPLQNVATFMVYVVSVNKPQHNRAEINRRHVADDIFKCIFLNENVWFSIKISDLRHLASMS